MTFFDVAALDEQQAYKLMTSVVVPRPIAWTVTKDAGGCVNAAPFSLFNFFSGSPPVVCIGMGSRGAGPKDSLANIVATKDFVINLVTDALLDAMNTTAVPFPAGCNELEMAGIATLPGNQVAVPRIAESPVALECRLWKVLELDAKNSLVMAHVLAVHVDDAAVVNATKCYIDGSKLHAVGRMQSPGWYTRTHDRFSLPQMSVEQWTARQEQDEAASTERRTTNGDKS